MKPVKLFEEFIDENVNNMIVYHTSTSRVTRFKPEPVWFTTNPILAKAYHNMNTESHTYEIKLSGKFLTQEEVKQLSPSLDVNYWDLVADLTANPTVEQRKKLIKPFIQECDGFYHWDYDPRDFKDGESLLVFNPVRSAKIIKQIL
jgi:hypothetical protein